MASTAADRFFGITELALLVASHLNSRDISRLMRTNRQMHKVMGPSLYRALTTYSHSKLIPSWRETERLRVLARNMQYVKTWGSDLLFLVYYYHATLAYKDNDNIAALTCPCDVSQPADMPQSTDVTQSAESSRTPLLFSSTTRGAFELVPLPAMSQLSKLELFLYPKDVELCRPYYLANFGNSRATIVRLCGILPLLPNLRELNLCGLLVRDTRSVQLLTSTLQGMVNLKRLNISISHERRFPGLITALCLGCPQSIEQLDICETHPYNDENHDDKNDDNDDSVLEEVGLGQLPDTKVLTHLRDLMLDDWDDIETAEEFLLVLEQCPNLEKIAMKWPLIPAEVDGAHIGRICPNLRSILYHGQGSIDDEGEDFWPIEIMETLPENQVESLEYQSSFDTSLNELLAKRTILRHSCTLRRVNLIASVSSAALRMVLEACGSLETLYCNCCPIDLIDASASSWASSNLTSLHLDICISPPSSPPSSHWQPSYLRTPPTTPSAEENEIFSQLELFYRQIGKQKNLEHLDLYLGRHIDPETGKVQEGARALPGMLTLQDNAGGRPGYMDLLYGLSKLRMIGGDIAAETKDDKIPEDAPEVDWILKHWPSLYFPSTKFFPPSRIPAS